MWRPSPQRSSSLCYGDLHPDAVIAKERQIRAGKKAYRAQLKDYHSDMTEVLTKWKDKWLTCENPESLFRDSPAKQRRRDLRSRGENAMFSKAPNNNTIPMKVVRNGDVTKYMSYIKVNDAPLEPTIGLPHQRHGRRLLMISDDASTCNLELLPASSLTVCPSCNYDLLLLPPATSLSCCRRLPRQRSRTATPTYFSYCCACVLLVIPANEL